MEDGKDCRDESESASVLASLRGRVSLRGQVRLLREGGGGERVRLRESE